MIIFAAVALSAAEPKSSANATAGSGQNVKLDRWEYGSIFSGNIEERYSWNDGVIRVAGTTLKEFIAALAAKKIITKPCDSWYSVLNGFGDLGWELIAVTEHSVGTTYQFKRRKM